jgi:hypothetical protein
VSSRSNLKVILQRSNKYDTRVVYECKYYTNKNRSNFIKIKLWQQQKY